jgi:hypothetical protein
MSLVPTTSSGGMGMSPRHTVQANRSQRRAEMAVYNHSLEVAVATEIDRIDSYSIADVITTATEEELRFLDYGMAMAGNSAARAELVARKLSLLSNINNARIARQFGR